MNKLHKFDLLLSHRQHEFIVDGTERIRKESQQTVFEMKKAMGLTGVWNRLRRKAERRSKKLEKQG